MKNNDTTTSQQNIERILDETWNLTDAKDTYHYVLPEHPFEWLVGHTQTGKRDIVFRSKEFIQLKKSDLSSRLVTCYASRQYQFFLLHFTLQDDSVYGVYLALAKDLLQTSSECLVAREALKHIVERFRLWKTMFSEPRSISEKIKGLLGELLMIERLSLEGHTPDEIVAAWTGPDYTEQDFVFPNSWYEVKSCRSSAMTITVNSAGQLDKEGQGWLYVFHLDETDSLSPNALSLSKQVQILKETVFASTPGAFDAFERKCTDYGYTFLFAAEDYCFIKGSVIRFLIDETFPKLTHAMKKPEMKSIHYELILAALEQWRKEL